MNIYIQKIYSKSYMIGQLIIYKNIKLLYLSECIINYLNKS